MRVSTSMWKTREVTRPFVCVAEGALPRRERAEPGQDAPLKAEL